MSSESNSKCISLFLIPYFSVFYYLFPATLALNALVRQDALMGGYKHAQYYTLFVLKKNMFYTCRIDAL